MSESILGGRYRVEARIGAGGMAEVFRGLDTTLNRTVAIKVLKPQFASDPSFVERFRREAQAAARLNHPNLVGVFDTGADNGTNFIVMEYVEGRTLADFMDKGGRLAPAKVVEIAEKIAEALAAAHAQGVIHRDIKTANVMVTRQGVVKVMDFGIARLTTGPDTIAQTASVLGTAAYISPEQAQGQPVDARSDIYSLGVVLYEMLTGAQPFTGDSAVAIAYKHVQENPRPPSALDPDIPARLDAVVMRAMAKNPANRYQSATEFGQDLERVRTGRDVEATPLLPRSDATQVIARTTATQIMPPVLDEPGSSRKVWMGVLIGFLIVAVLGGGGYLLATSLLGDNGSTTTEQKVPSVIGFSREAATSTLENLGFDVVVKQKTDDTVEPGIVLFQDPVSGTLLKEGETVTLTVSRSPKTVLVPDITGMTLSEAQAELEAVNLTLGTQTTAPSDSVDAGKIISQNPSVDTPANAGDPVNVVVSSGTDKVTVPDVTCFSFGKAKAQLTQLGLIVIDGGTAPANPLCPTPNRVAVQAPAPGTQVNSGTTITLYLNESSPSPSPT